MVASNDAENLIHLHSACHKQEHSKTKFKAGSMALCRVIGKLSRTVLRGGARGDSQTLPDIKQTIGQSPYQFLTSYRVEQAKKMLDNPYKLMVDIAIGCGFSDQAHFSRVFKEIEGTTPKQYKNK